MAVSDDRLMFSGEVTRAESEAAFTWHAASLRERAQPSWTERIASTVIVMAILLVGVPAAVIVLEPRDTALVAMLAAVFGFVVTIAMARYATLRITRRIQLLRTANLGRTTYTFGPDGYGIELASGISSMTPWSAIKRMEVVPQHIAFWHDGYFAQTLPRSIVGEPSRESQLLAAIRGWAPHLASDIGALNPS